MITLAKLRRFQRSVHRVAQTRYPRFLFGLPLAKGEVPIFTYHDVTPQGFAGDLGFLRDNGYRTLGIDEYLDTVRAGGAERSVLLTFDDARRSFWDTAFPLLRQFKARATLFVPTYWMEGARITQSTPVMSGYFMSWDQLRECASSGHVDVQSHACRHALVYTSRRLVGFASPSMLAHYDVYDWPMRRCEGRDTLGCPPLGTPVYEAAPLLSATCRVLEDETVVRACHEAVRRGGGEGFFASTDWEQRLRQVHAEASCQSAEIQPIPERDFKALVASEIHCSQADFERELGYRARFLAYPWMLGSALSLELASAAGIVAVFGVGLDFGRTSRLTGPLQAFGRFKADWLQFLPGHGRLRIHQVLPARLASFFKSQHLAH